MSLGTSLTTWFSPYLRIIEWSVLALILAGTAWAAQHMRGIADEKAKTEAVAAKGAADASSCANNEKISKGANDALLGNCYTSLNECRATISVPSKCVPIHHADAASSVASAQRGSDDTGLESRFLVSYQSQCKLIQKDYNACVAHDTECVNRSNGIN